MDVSWWDIKRRRLRNAIQEINEKETITVVEDVFSFVPENDIPGVNLIHKNHSYFDDQNNRADIFINQGYSHDIDALWHVTKTGRVGVTSCWFWDNHHLFKSTMRGSILADVTFVAHNFAAHNYFNELGQYGGFVPLCPIFWGSALVERISNECENKPRSNAIYGGYNSYQEFAERDVFLNEIKDKMPDHHIRQWPHGTPWSEHGYYSLSHEDKLREWCSFKVALCVSFGPNTTIRMFEALIGGQIPLVVGNISDLNLIISPEDQVLLPIICVPGGDVNLVADAFGLALKSFDQEGEVGVRRRRLYAQQRHMPRNRLVAMIDAIKTLNV